jgi:hypothetical protein
VGAVYKRNPRFEVTGVEKGEFTQKPGEFRSVLKIPDIFGVGVSIKASDNLVISSDLVRIEYSDLLEGFQVGYNFLTDIYSSEDIAYGIKNAYEFHVGAEILIVLKDIPIALRQGYYRKPSNSLFVKAMPGVLPGVDDKVILAVFTEQEGENHITIGSGFVFSDFQIDWAFDASESVNNFIVSTVVRF